MTEEGSYLAPAPPGTPRMIWHHLSRSFRTRKAEWLATLILMTIGANLLVSQYPWLIVVHEVSRANGVNTGTTAFGMLGIGGLRLFALAVNGLWRRTPYLRAIMSIIFCWAWAQAAVAAVLLELSGVPNQEVAIFPWLLAFDLYSCWQASRDGMAADEQARRQAGRSGGGTSSGIA